MDVVVLESYSSCVGEACIISSEDISKQASEHCTDGWWISHYNIHLQKS
jgi:hypothetical protein